MSTDLWPSGVLTALLTPLRDDQIDFDALGALLERQVAAAVGAVVVCGGTGEFGSLTLDERQELASFVASRLAGRLPFIVQTGALTTRDAITLSRHAEEVGSLGLLLASPFGEPISWAERLQFYRDVHESVTLPIMIYNTPPSGILTLGQIQELVALPRVTAVKDSSGDITLAGDILSWAAEASVAAYLGLDSLVTYAGRFGARGVLNGTGNIIPEELSATFRLAQQAERAAELDRLWPAMRRFLRFLEESSNYVALCKVVSALDGLELGAVRRPYLMPGEEERARLAAEFSALKRAFSAVAV